MRLFCAIVFAIVLATSIASAAVTVKGLTYSIKSISRAASVGDDTYGEKASGEFIVIKLSVTNSGSEPATISNGGFHLKSGDVKYDSAGSAGMTAGGFFLKKLNPGVTATGNLVFDVPANTPPSKYRLIVYGNGSSDSREIQL